MFSRFWTILSMKLSLTAGFLALVIITDLLAGDELAVKGLLNKLQVLHHIGTDTNSLLES